MKKRRSFTLIEIMIALGLMALLCSSLLFWVRFASINQKSYEKTKWQNLEEYYCKQRLEKLFNGSVLDNEKENNDAPLLTFYSKNNSIVFTTDIGPFPEPKLSNVVLAELFLTEDHLLVVALWPLPYKDKKISQEPSLVLPLLDHVAKIDLSFYQPDRSFNIVVKPEEVGHPKPRVGWNVVWSKEFNERPAIIKLLIERETDDPLKNQPLEWLFETDCNKAIMIHDHKRSKR